MRDLSEEGNIHSAICHESIDPTIHLLSYSTFYFSIIKLKEILQKRKNNHEIMRQAIQYKTMRLNERQ